MRRAGIIAVGIITFVLFFVFVPVVPTRLYPCLLYIGASDYASLSNRFFGVGGVYIWGARSYQFWTHGVVFCW